MIFRTFGSINGSWTSAIFSPCTKTLWESIKSKAHEDLCEFAEMKRERKQYK